MVEFEQEAHWDMDCLIFWARNGKDPVLCKVSRPALAEIRGLEFPHETTTEIGVHKAELKRIFEPYVRAKIEQNEWFQTQPLTVLVKLADVPHR